MRKEKEGGQEKRTWKVGLRLTCFRSHFLMSKVCKVPPAARPSRLPPTSSHALHNDQQLNRGPCATLEAINYITNDSLPWKQYTHEFSRLLQLFWLLNCCFSSWSSRLVSINFSRLHPSAERRQPKGQSKPRRIGCMLQFLSFFERQGVMWLFVWILAQSMLSLVSCLVSST